MAGLKRSRWPTCRMRPPRRGQRDQAAPLVERRGDRLLDQHVDAVLEQRGSDREVRRRRHGDAGAVDAAEQRLDGGRAPARRRAPAIAAARSRSAVDDADQLDAGQAGVLLGVEGAEVADADDRGAHRAQPPSARTPTMARSAAAARAAAHRARAAASCRPRGRARRCRPRGRRATVAGPTAGTSKRRSCPGLLTFTATAPPRAERAAAAQRRVGALERLDGQHDARLHHHRLADVPGADALGDGEAVARCRAICAASGCRARQRPLRREERAPGRGSTRRPRCPRLPAPRRRRAAARRRSTASAGRGSAGRARRERSAPAAPALRMPPAMTARRDAVRLEGADRWCRAGRP